MNKYFKYELSIFVVSICVIAHLGGLNTSTIYLAVITSLVGLTNWILNQESPILHGFTNSREERERPTLDKKEVSIQSIINSKVAETKDSFGENNHHAATYIYKI